VRTATEALRSSLDVAREAGVIIAIENVADRLRDRDSVGARLTEVAEVIGALGGGDGSPTPVGWTFDIAHALLGHGGDVESVQRDAQWLLSSLVHIHINSPRLHLSERAWADQHEAPQESSQSVWKLFALACAAPRFRAAPVVTYEVSWALPGLRSFLGGSSLPEVIRGYELVRRIATESLGTRAETLGRSPLQQPHLARPWTMPAGAFAG
jgi:hypothetical protein